MNLPEMVLFDYGNTIITEELIGFDKGNEAVLAYAVKNPRNITVKELQPEFDRLIGYISDRMGAENRNYQPFELSWCSINRYVYESYGIYFDKTYEELERIYWDAAVKAYPAQGIEELLCLLRENGIGTGVVSNLMHSGKTLSDRINRVLPGSSFEFVISSCDYIFRKPEREIFSLALNKAGLKPEKVWFCGDNPVCDIEGALSAGMTPVWYRKTFKEKPGMKMTIPSDKYIALDSWAQLTEIIKGCLN